MKCEYCGGDVEIRNPTGRCDHLYYPENVNKNFKRMTIMNKNLDEILDKEQKFCIDDCRYLNPTEENQTDEKEAHICSKFHYRIFHMGSHPRLGCNPYCKEEAKREIKELTQAKIDVAVAEAVAHSVSLERKRILDRERLIKFLDNWANHNLYDGQGLANAIIKQLGTEELEGGE